MIYRTKTYIAGDWTGDQDLISQLYKWNNRDDLRLSFTDAHELAQARDTSLPCSIKRSLADRLDATKTFVLIVGKDTDKLTKGSCRYCNSYDSYHGNCHRGHYVDYRSFIRYECEKAQKDGIRIVVLYNYADVNRSKCPDILRYEGTHINAYYVQDGKSYWNYSKIRDALMK